MKTIYTIHNVPSLGPYDGKYSSMEKAEAYMEERGYIYVTSAACDHPTEEARYFVRQADVEEELGLDIEDVDLNDDLLDRVYGYGYEPCIMPEEEA